MIGGIIKTAFKIKCKVSRKKGKEKGPVEEVTVEDDTLRPEAAPDYSQDLRPTQS